MLDQYTYCLLTTKISCLHSTFLSYIIYTRTLYQTNTYASLALLCDYLFIQIIVMNVVERIKSSVYTSSVIINEGEKQGR